MQMVWYTVGRVEQSSTLFLVQVFVLSGLGERRPVLFLSASRQIPHHLLSSWARMTVHDICGVHSVNLARDTNLLAHGNREF